MTAFGNPCRVARIMNRFRMCSLRVGGSTLLVSFLGAVCWLMGGSSGCSGPAYDIWTCESADGGNLNAIPVGTPSRRPAGCPCATDGPPTDPNGKPYTYPQGSCPGIDGGADAGPIPDASSSTSSSTSSSGGSCPGQCDVPPGQLPGDRWGRRRRSNTKQLEQLVHLVE
jgi:hypothetical protein